MTVAAAAFFTLMLGDFFAAFLLHRRHVCSLRYNLYLDKERSIAWKRFKSKDAFSLILLISRAQARRVLLRETSQASELSKLFSEG